MAMAKCISRNINSSYMWDAHRGALTVVGRISYSGNIFIGTNQWKFHETLLEAVKLQTAIYHDAIFLTSTLIDFISPEII